MNLRASLLALYAKWHGAEIIMRMRDQHNQDRGTLAHEEYVSVLLCVARLERLVAAKHCSPRTVKLVDTRAKTYWSRLLHTPDDDPIAERQLDIAAEFMRDLHTLMLSYEHDLAHPEYGVSRSIVHVTALETCLPRTPLTREGKW